MEYLKYNYTLSTWSTHNTWSTKVPAEVHGESEPFACLEYLNYMKYLEYLEEDMEKGKAVSRVPGIS